MSLSVLVSMFAAGLFSSNVIASSGVGVDLATNSLNNLKNALYYSLVIFAVSILSAVSIYLAELAFVALEIEKFLIVASLLIVSMYVQMAEHLVKKLTPLFYTQTKYLVPSLVSTLFIVVICAFASTTTFLELITLIFFESVGVLLVLTIMAGVRNSGLVDRKHSLLKGNLVSLVILLLIMMAWTAF